MENEEKLTIYLAILNITSWCGISSDAEHVYGTLILSKNEEVTIDDVEDWNVKYLGKNIEIRQPITLEMAIKFDEKDGGKFYQRAFHRKDELKDNDDFNEFIQTNRFDSFDDVVAAGIKKWRELDIDCPFISLYNGEKYKSNNYNSSSTVIILNK